MENHILETLTAVITAFVSCMPTCIWQIIVIGALIYFRQQITGLFDRIATFRIGETEVAFQPPARNATKLGAEAEKQIVLLGPGGFFTQDGIAQLIERSGLVDTSEKAVAQLLLFQTKRQHTWLVATTENLFCVLDDENTQATGKLVQWKLPLKDTSPVQVKALKSTVGLVSINVRRNWLYSRYLHPSEDALRSDIETMIEKAKKAA